MDRLFLGGHESREEEPLGVLYVQPGTAGSDRVDQLGADGEAADHMEHRGAAGVVDVGAESLGQQAPNLVGDPLLLVGQGLVRRRGGVRVVLEVQQDLHARQVGRRTVVLVQQVVERLDPFRERRALDVALPDRRQEPPVDLLERGQHEGLAGAEVILDRAPAEVRAPGDLVRACPVEAELQDAGDGGLDDLRPSGRVLRGPA
ncbi:hypothetical protein [Frankia nepalensis]|uniref:hypothetical protein n=1 Tax=Frankia nepalensis TaxID=1836974 RepID=UPI001EE47E84|nr:hypothetical protein [Frankia nepalensis]